MTYVPGCKHDIFVSYAHDDDAKVPGADAGWVTTLVEAFQAQLKGKLDSDYSLWMDYELSRRVEWTPQIIDALQNTATLVVVISPRYTSSDWCKRERNTFLKMVEDRTQSNSRVFVIEPYKLEDKERPPEFREKGFRFWVQEREGEPPRTLGYPKPNPNNPQDRPYYERLNRLTFELAEELKQLKTAALEATAKPSTERAENTVFLAEVTDDLEDRRDEVTSYLEQQNLSVVPKILYARDIDAFRKAVNEDLKRCKLFVQMLSGIVGKRPPGLPASSYAELQWGLAKAAGKPIVQWRSVELDLKTLPDTSYRDLLDGETVLAVGLEEFKKEIVKKAFYKPPSVKPRHAFVFLDLESGDRVVGTAVCDFLDQCGIEYALPLTNGKPLEIREDLERNLRDCDGVIVIYGTSTVSWVREHLSQCRKIIANRDEPLKALAIYEGPPEQKDELNMKLYNMRVLNCRHGLSESELKSFIANL